MSAAVPGGRVRRKWLVEAGVDAEAEEEVALVRGVEAIGGGGGGQEEAVEDGDEASGPVGGGLDSSADEGIMADGGAEDGVAASDRTAVAAEHSRSPAHRGKGGIAEGIDARLQGPGDCTAGGAGEGGAIQFGLLFHSIIRSF